MSLVVDYRRDIDSLIFLNVDNTNAAVTTLRSQVRHYYYYLHFVAGHYYYYLRYCYCLVTTTTTYIATTTTHTKRHRLADISQRG